MSRPVARPKTLSREPENPRPGAAYAEFSTPKGSVPSPSRYLTADRLHRTAVEMSQRDWELLRLVHDSRFMSGRQLVRAFWGTSEHDSSTARAGRRALKRLVLWRVVETLPRRIGGVRTGSAGLVYYVGRAGVRLLAQRGIHGPRVEVPGTRHLAHTLATTELALRLREAGSSGSLELLEVQQEPACWREYLGTGGARRVLKPDLFIRVGAGELEDRWMVELDLASESGQTIVRKAGAYLEDYRSGREQRGGGAYPRVLWAVPDQRRAEQLREVLRRTPAEAQRLFAVRLIDEVVGFLADEARE